MKLLTILLLISPILLFSCTKDKPPKKPFTVYPGEYFPVWPGSWWKYTNSSDTNFTYSTEDDFRLIGGSTDPWGV